jgi:ABC-type glutathione transport system ATPase component
MGEKENVVSFNTALDVKYHRYILDFLSGIDMENSMAYLPVTIHDPCITQEEYSDDTLHLTRC